MNLVEHRFQVPGMNCGHCVASITKALQPLGVQIWADAGAKQLTVEAPPALPREQIVAVLTQAGYPPA